MSNYSLIVIDMQLYFESARDERTQKECSKLIRKAIKDNAPIVLVEYSGCGKTAPTLAGLVAGYKNAHVVKKSNDDGGYEIVSYLRRKRLPRGTIKVCGVNTNCCVKQTIRGIKEEMRYREPTIQVVERACNSSSNWGHREGIEDLELIGAEII